MDVAGLLWGVLFYAIALVLAFLSYTLYSPLYKRPFLVILLCCVAHYAGSFAYSTQLTDSLIQFFDEATPVFTGFGTGFVKNMTWYVRQYLTGDSYLGTVYFFSAFAFMGSVLWYVLYIQLTQELKISNQKYLFPAFVLMCWPSYLFFTSGIGKDSLSFFLMPLIFLLWSQLIYQRRFSVLKITVLILALCLVVFIRPYLFMLLVLSYFMSNFKGIKKLFVSRVILILLFLPIAFYICKWVVSTQGGIQVFDISNITSRAILQQDRLNVGTSFTPLSSDPSMIIFSLIYGFIMNLIMPLFIYAHNLTAILASVENGFLVWIIYKFWKKRFIYKQVKASSQLVQLCFSFFVVGMGYLGLINTNLGLAIRQKSMFVPAFLVVAMLVWLYDKQQLKNRNLGCMLDLQSLSVNIKKES